MFKKTSDILKNNSKKILFKSNSKENLNRKDNVLEGPLVGNYNIEENYEVIENYDIEKNEFLVEKNEFLAVNDSYLSISLKLSEFFKDTYGEHKFKNWFNNIKCIGLDRNILFLSVPTKFIRELILTNYFDTILNYVKVLNSKICTINISIEKYEATTDVRVLNDDIEDTNGILSYETINIQRGVGGRVLYDNKKYFCNKENDGSYNKNNDIYKNSYKVYGNSKNKKYGVDGSLSNEINVNGVNTRLFESNNNIKYKQEYSTSALNSKYTFDNFIFGDSNRFAYFAARQLSNSFSKFFNIKKNKLQNLDINKSIKSTESNEVGVNSCNFNNYNFNSLYIHSSVGMGKTHLLHAIGNYIKMHFEDVRLTYFTAEKFTQQYVMAIRNNKLTEFKEELSKVDILLIDDLQLICGKNSTEKEFVNTFDILVENSKKIVVASDRQPYELNLDSRTKSRLAGSIVVSIKEVDFNLKMKILENKMDHILKNNCGSGGGFSSTLNYELLELIANNVTNSIRELEAVLYRIYTYSELLEQEVNLDMARKIIDDQKGQAMLLDSMSLDPFSKKNTSKIRVKNNNIKNSHINKNKYINQGCFNKEYFDRKIIDEDNFELTQYTSSQITNSILNEVVNFFDIKLDDLFSKNRSAKLLMIRQITVYILREYTTLNFKEIGFNIGNRNYSTIIYLYNRCKKSIDKQKNDKFRMQVNLLKQKLLNLKIIKEQ